MPVPITIRDVPTNVRDELASRAAIKGQSVQAYLLSELVRLAARPSVDAWLIEVRKRKSASQNQVGPKQTILSRDQDRR